MRTPPRGYLAALIGSMLGSGLLAWASAWFILATDDRSAVIAGPGLALFFAIHGYGWLGVGLGCWLALLVRRAHAIGWTVVLMMLLSPIVATLHGTVSLAALQATCGGGRVLSKSGRWNTKQLQGSGGCIAVVAQGCRNVRPACRPHQVQQRVPHRREHLGSMAGIHLMRIFAQRHIPHVMHAVLNGPVSSPPCL